MSHRADPPHDPRSHEEQGATEEQTEKIDAIAGDEVLGYEGSGRGEHSGQEESPVPDRLSDTLANNRPEEVLGAKRQPADVPPRRER